MIFKTLTIMLFERIFNKTFILFVRFSKHEQLCYSNDFSIKNLFYLNDFSKHEQLCYLNEFLIKYLSYLNDFQNMKNYII